ncbi:MAG: alanyl-tRNA editing protein [Roseiflexaceae bacterium]
MSTERIYLNTPQQTHVVTMVVATRPGAFAVAASPCFVGGGGQPVDTGVVSVDGANQRIEHVEVDAEDHIWHHSAAIVVPGQAVDLVVDKQRRRTISRYHTALHVLNTLALTHYQAWITGAQMTEAYARIDFAIEWLDPVMLADLEARMNAVLVAYHPVQYRYVSVTEFAQRSDLLRTKNVQPPAYRGQVRVVEIEGFDAQACGGTHAESTHEVGPCCIYKSENKGKQNKRLYIRFA